MPPSGKSRAVFLDRDGVINRSIVRDGKPYAPVHLEDIELLPGVSDACTQLANAGYLLIVVTNQPDVSTGKASLGVVPMPAQSETGVVSSGEERESVEFAVTRKNTEGLW